MADPSMADPSIWPTHPWHVATWTGCGRARGRVVDGHVGGLWTGTWTGSGQKKRAGPLWPRPLSSRPSACYAMMAGRAPWNRNARAMRRPMANVATSCLSFKKSRDVDPP